MTTLRTRYFARAAIFLAATLIVPHPPASRADEPDEQAGKAPPIAEAQELGWTEAQLRSVATSTNSTLAQAAERVVADVLYEQLVAHATAAYPNELGGYRIKSTGATALTLFFTREAERFTAASLQAVAPTAPRVSARTVERTEGELRALYDRAIARNSELVERDAGEQLARVELDRANNRVVMAIDTGESHGPSAVNESRSVEDMQERAAGHGWDGLKIVEETRTVRPAQNLCVSRDDCRSMRGGVSIVSNYSRCTMSYTGYDKVANEAFVVTNAHCGRLSPTPSNYWQGYSPGQGWEIGPRGRAVDNIFPEPEPGVSYGYDAVRIPDLGPQVGIRPFVYRSRQQAEYPVYAVGAGRLHLEGRVRCFAGRVTSGPTDPDVCGTSGYGPAMKVYEHGDRRWAVANSFSFDTVCVRDGDSGAPVINPSGHYLDGHIWGFQEFVGTCTFGASSDYNLVEHSADALGLRVLLATPPCSNQPPVTCR